MDKFQDVKNGECYQSVFANDVKSRNVFSANIAHVLVPCSRTTKKVTLRFVQSISESMKFDPTVLIVAVYAEGFMMASDLKGPSTGAVKPVKVHGNVTIICSVQTSLLLLMRFTGEVKYFCILLSTLLEVPVPMGLVV